jgi:hypothetical protein
VFIVYPRSSVQRRAKREGSFEARPISYGKDRLEVNFDAGAKDCPYLFAKISWALDNFVRPESCNRR